MALINLKEVGVHPALRGGKWQVHFGTYLPRITPAKGYALKVRVIHELDQFVKTVPPADFDLAWVNGSALDLWEATIPVVAAPAGAGGAAPGHFGQDGTYLYRFQLLRHDEVITTWFADPFGTANGVGGVSAFTLDRNAASFPWTDGSFAVPEVDDLVVYELHVGEFNRDFDGVRAQLPYLRGLGVNALELLPITDVKEVVEWGYTPLGYFAPDERYGGCDAFKRLVDAAHAENIAIILDAVYAHSHPEFAYNLVYKRTGEPNPMMGRFMGEFFEPPNTPFTLLGADYTKQFTQEYFLEVNRRWLEEFHVDGFRYDYVPGFYDGPAGVGYARLVYGTYEASKTLKRFQATGGRSRLIQCAEHLESPQEMLKKTYSNTAWQDGLLHLAASMAKDRVVTEALGHQLDVELKGYPSTYTNPATGDALPVAPFQYFETHDHGRFLARLAPTADEDVIGQPLGDRRLFYRMQPFIIGLFTGKGVPMLWHGQEFGENWNLPGMNKGVRNLLERPLHWEYFYDAYGQALVRLHRIMGELRGSLRSLKSRGHFYYFDRPEHRARKVIAFRREAPAAGASPAEHVMVALNFSDDSSTAVDLEFPVAGTWVEQIDKGGANPRPNIRVGSAGQQVSVPVPANYGVVYLCRA